MPPIQNTSTCMLSISLPLATNYWDPVVFTKGLTHTAEGLTHTAEEFHHQEEHSSSIMHSALLDWVTPWQPGAVTSVCACYLCL